jgi:hypothetical protein
MDIPAILTDRYPGTSWSLNGDTYDGLDWHDDSQKPSEDELAALWPEVQSDRAWAAVRAERDALLAACDWTQVADAPVDAQVWADYRQALRDVPQDFSSPDEVVFPAVP